MPAQTKPAAPLAPKRITARIKKADAPRAPASVQREEFRVMLNDLNSKLDELSAGADRLLKRLA